VVAGTNLGVCCVVLPVWCVWRGVWWGGFGGCVVGELWGVWRNQVDNQVVRGIRVNYKGSTESEKERAKFWGGG